MRALDRRARDVDALDRQDHVAELADADEDDLGGADLLPICAMHSASPAHFTIA